MKSEALNLAINVILSYRTDIRDWHDGELVQQGFCQGTIYQNALGDIAKLARKEGIDVYLGLEPQP